AIEKSGRPDFAKVTPGGPDCTRPRLNHFAVASAFVESIGEHYEGRIDLLLTDVVMPGMSGPELAKRVRAARPEIKVLFVSGYGDQEAVQRSMGDIDANLLNKPFGHEDLARTVRRMLDTAAKRRKIR
ncbi:MAG: response regulator, partial [Phycisphaerae bacterium]|nr:response regulator [Phycisphaerae bacterium]